MKVNAEEKPKQKLKTVNAVMKKTNVATNIMMNIKKNVNTTRNIQNTPMVAKKNKNN